jgi:hypothetical protein
MQKAQVETRFQLSFMLQPKPCAQGCSVQQSTIYSGSVGDQPGCYCLKNQLPLRFFWEIPKALSEYLRSLPAAYCVAGY